MNKIISEIYGLRWILIIITLALTAGLVIPSPLYNHYGEKLNKKIKQTDKPEIQLSLLHKSSGTYLKLPEKHKILGPSSKLTSMLPTLQSNYKIISTPINQTQELRPGNIVTYEKKDYQVIHRVYRVNEEEDCVVTLGDNNGGLDRCIPIQNITGKVTMVITDNLKEENHG